MTGSTFGLIKALRAMTMVAALVFGGYGLVSAHCDTVDGPVVQDARKALAAGDVTPVLKWVQAKDEKSIKAAFNKALAAQGKKQQQAEEKRFFESLVRIHRAGEGAPFTGLKPAGEVEPVIAEADKALAGGSPDGLVGMVNDAVSQGIRQRYGKAAEASKHKDESVQKGREYVAAYVEYTHYLERLQNSAEGHTAHDNDAAGKKHAAPAHKHGH